MMSSEECRFPLASSLCSTELCIEKSPRTEPVVLPIKEAATILSPIHVLVTLLPSKLPQPTGILVEIKWAGVPQNTMPENQYGTSALLS